MMRCATNKQRFISSRLCGIPLIEESNAFITSTRSVAPEMFLGVALLALSCMVYSLMFVALHLVLVVQTIACATTAPTQLHNPHHASWYHAHRCTPSNVHALPPKGGPQHPSNWLHASDVLLIPQTHHLGVCAFSNNAASDAHD
jgi:hypothetical protein